MVGKMIPKSGWMVLVVILFVPVGTLSLAHADCELVYSSKVTTSLGGQTRYGPMSDSKCNAIKQQQMNVVGSSNVWCECTSGGSSGSSSSGSYSGKNAMQYQMMQGISKAIGEGIRQGMENARKLEEEQAKEAERQAELKKQEEKRKNDKARSDWNQLKQKEAEAALKKEQAMKIRVNELLQQMGSSTGEMQIESIGGGTGFFGSDTLKPQSIVFKPIGNGGYDASKTLAIPEPPIPTPVFAAQEEAYQQKKKMITLEIEQNVKQLQEIKTKLHENGDKIKEAEVAVKEIQTKAATEITPEKQKEVDRLVAEANALLVESKEEQEKLISEENKLQENIQEKNRELKEQFSTPQSKGEMNEKR